MVMYTLYNETTNRQLTHPQVGLWYTSDLEEAEDMLSACKEYMESINLPQEVINKVRIVEVTDETES